MRATVTRRRLAQHGCLIEVVRTPCSSMPARRAVFSAIEQELHDRPHDQGFMAQMNDDLSRSEPSQPSFLKCCSPVNSGEDIDYRDEQELRSDEGRFPRRTLTR